MQPAPLVANPRTRPARIVALAAWLLALALVLHFLAVAQQKYAQLDAAAYGMFWSRRG